MSRDFVAAPAAARVSGPVRILDSIVALVRALRAVRSRFGAPACEPPDGNRATGASIWGGTGDAAIEGRFKVQNQLQLFLRATAMAPMVPLVADRRAVVDRGRSP
jgi:hypothetical protein